MEIFNGDFTQYKGFDLLIGGSPCTYWSIAKRNRETTCDGEGFKLFMEYVRALKESKCRYFIYENNYSIHKDIKSEISRQLGVEPVMINSALISAQSRKRCYWTNIPGITQPEDKGILLKDIIESGITWSGKSYRFCKSYSKAAIHECFKAKERKSVMAAEPLGCAIRSRYTKSRNRSIKCDGGTYHAVEIRKDGKANCMTTVTKDCMIMHPIRIGDIGSKAQGQRVYSIKGKSVTISAGGGVRAAQLDYTK